MLRMIWCGREPSGKIIGDFVAQKCVSKYQTKGATTRTQNADSLIYFIIISSC